MQPAKLVTHCMHAYCEKIQIDSPHPSLTHADRYRHTSNFTLFIVRMILIRPHVRLHIMLHFTCRAPRIQIRAAEDTKGKKQTAICIRAGDKM